jgi:DNA helicase-2/ATP-dependent DNA helicase PcrA
MFLSTNYRSTKNIIGAGSKLVEHNYSDNGGPYPQSLIKATDSRPDAAEGKPVGYHWFETIDEECDFVGSTIQEKQEAKPGDFYVGTRTKAQLAYLEGVLFRKEIPFVNITGSSFWESWHVSVIIGYIKLALSRKDKKALRKVYNIATKNHVYSWGKQEGEYCPTRYLGGAFLEKINYDIDNIPDVLTERDAWRWGNVSRRKYSKYGAGKAQDLLEFVNELEQLTQQIDHAGQLAQVIFDDCLEKYLKHKDGLGAGSEESTKLDDIKAVIDIASEHEDPEDFLEHVDQMIQAAQAAREGNMDDYVVISTYHRLKGKERPVIFCMGWAEGHKTTKAGIEKPVGLLPHTFSLDDPPNFGVLPVSYRRSPIYDERSIAFVAVTRAKEECYVSGCKYYRDWVMSPSRFAVEMGLVVEDKELQ